MSSKAYLGQTVFITGASSGIGEALALELAHQGADLAIAARRKDRLEKLKTKIEALGRKALVLECDVRNASSIQAAVSETIKKLGKIDCSIVNAGYSVAGPFEKLATERYREQFETNVFGALETTRATLPELKKTHGRLVLIGSVMSYLSIPATGAYAMSKYALRAFSEALEGELKGPEGGGVSVTLICPGFVRSEIRKIDNSGKFGEDNVDDAPDFLQMPAETAAKKIAHAVYRRKREAVITNHGKIFVFIARHCPGVIRLAIRMGVKRKRGAKGEL